MIDSERLKSTAGRIIAESPTQAQALLGPGVSTPATQEHEYVAHLFDTYYDFVWKLVRRLGVRSPDDAAQQVFIITARKVQDIDRARAQSFLHGVAIRVASDARDSAGRRGGPAQELDEQAPSPEPSPDELLDRKRTRQRLDEILSAMGLEERTAFVLFEIEGLTMAEIATLAGIPPGTVASRLRRARETFANKVARLRLGGTK